MTRGHPGVEVITTTADGDARLLQTARHLPGLALGEHLEHLGGHEGHG